MVAGDDFDTEQRAWLLAAIDDGKEDVVDGGSCLEFWTLSERCARPLASVPTRALA